MKTVLAAAVVALTASSAAYASCRIHNETGYSYTIESGNTSNQRVGSHTTTSIASGKVKAKSDDGKHNFGGSCKDGEEVVVKEEGGVVVMETK